MMCESREEVLGVCLGEVRNKPAPNPLSEAKRPGMDMPLGTSRGESKKESFAFVRSSVR